MIRACIAHELHKGPFPALCIIWGQWGSGSACAYLCSLVASIACLQNLEKIWWIKRPGSDSTECSGSSMHFLFTYIIRTFSLVGADDIVNMWIGSPCFLYDIVFFLVCLFVCLFFVCFFFVVFSFFDMNLYCSILDEPTQELVSRGDVVSIKVV